MLILKPSCPPESSVRLINPERGFFAIIRAELTLQAQDMTKLAEAVFTPERDDLLLCEISLRRFADCGISAEGLRQVRELLSALKARNGSLILRFLYDWDGKGMAAEPRSLDLILEHIRQLGSIVSEHSNGIFLHQGLFTGSWGEMHGTRYSSPDDMAKLYLAQREAFGPDLLLCVRTIGQLRHLEKLPCLGRSIGLYNDGMMGSATDLGSYASDGYQADREEALLLQSRICLSAPNGGEAVYNPRYSDFREALKTLRKMRVSYLNRYHDTRVLEAWAKTRISAPGIWYGMDGLSYIERHLGYRYVISDVSMSKSLLQKTLRVRLTLSNIGFAPPYHKLYPKLTLRKEDAPSRSSYEINCMPEGGSPFGSPGKKRDMSHAAGKRAEAGSMAFFSEIKLPELPRGSFRLYFSLWSEKYGREILLGNEGPKDLGYPIGGFELT